MCLSVRKPYPNYTDYRRNVARTRTQRVNIKIVDVGEEGAGKGLQFWVRLELGLDFFLVDWVLRLCKVLIGGGQLFLMAGQSHV